MKTTKTAALVTKVKAGKAAGTHKLISHGSMFLSYRSKFRDLGNTILAVGVKNELRSKIPLTNSCSLDAHYIEISHISSSGKNHLACLDQHS